MDKKEMTALVKNAKQGNEKAFEQLYNEFAGLAQYAAYKILNDKELAEDIAQETFAAVFQNMKSLKTEAAFPAWVKRIASNLAAAELRKNKEVLHPNGETPNDIAADKSIQPENIADKADTQKIVAGLINQLPAKQRAAMVMFYFSEMKVKEIALATGASVDNTKQRLSRARKTLKENITNIEKAQGIKLHSISGAVITAGLASEAAGFAAVPFAAAAGATAGAGSAAGSAAASAAGAVGGMSAAAKAVLITVLSLSVLGGGGYGAYRYIDANTDIVGLQNVAVLTQEQTLNCGETLALDYHVEIAVDETIYTLENGKASEDISDKALSQLDDFSYTWESSDPDVAFVENGTVTAAANGEATITLHTAYQEKTVSSSLIIHVTTPVSAINITPEKLELNKGETDSITAAVLPETASEQGVLYESSDEDIAAVDANGNIVAVSAGVCQIKAYSAENPDIYALCEIQVQVVPESIEISETEASIREGRSGQFEIALTPDPEEITVDFNLEISVSDENVVAVQPDGAAVKYTAKKAGTATITITLLIDGEEIDSVDFNITVTEAPKTQPTAGSGNTSSSSSTGSSSTGGGSTGGGSAQPEQPAPAPQPPATSSISAQEAANAALGVGGFLGLSSSGGCEIYAGWSTSMFNSQEEANAMAISQAQHYANKKGAAEYGILHAWVDGDNFYVGISFSHD